MNHLSTPSNSEAEQGVIACLLFNPRTIAHVVDTLAPEHFEQDALRTTYEAIVNLYRRGKAATLPNVRDELRRLGSWEEVEQVAHLEELRDGDAPFLGTIGDYAEAVRAAATDRHFMLFGAELVNRAHHRDPELLAWAEREFTKLVLGADTKPVATMAEAVDRYMSSYEQRREDFKAGKPAGLSTGYLALDRLLGGFFPSKLYMLAARTGLGKSAIALNLALHLVRSAGHVLFFSCEMDEEELMQRIFSIQTHIDQTLLRDANTDTDQHKLMHEAAGGLRDLDLKLDDRALTLPEICHKAKQVHFQKPLSLLVVDYIQLLKLREGGRAKNELRHEELGDISMGLKHLSRELRVPVLALAQLGRKSEERELPSLVDLAESDRLARDSDVVLLLHVDESEQEKRNQNKQFLVHVLARKQRGGPMGQVSLVYTPGLTRFDPPAPEYRHDPYAD